ncbi:MAG: cation:proton antiporter [Bacteroidales bacterium]|nr:cation:proton antiporter [Bacteroidales bacterium]
MDESLNLVKDLALIFISAGIITLIFRALKQPLILGYIVAGFLVGPHFGLFPGLTKPETIEQWSEIGIIFLLFALGLEFSFKKLLKVGSSALITAATIFFGMFVTGMAVGGAMGWSHMERIFLGGMLSMSSTTIIIKAFDDLGLKGMPFTNVVFGTLVVEDLLAVVLMVLLSTMAVSQQFAGGEMAMALLKLLFFLVLWFVVGMFLIPTLFKKGRQVMNEEMLVILSVGLCFGMVALATAAGFSSALGAFVMGSLLAETLEGEHISHSIKNIKDLFGAIFFVSVGMMVDPAIIVQYWQPILILIVVVVIGIPLFATSGVLMAGQGLHSAVRSGFSMAQIGEFAFIIASLGKSLGVMADYIYPVVVAVSVITTFTTPYFMKLSEPFYGILSRKLPPRMFSVLSEVRGSGHSQARDSQWKQLIKAYLIRMIPYNVMLLAILLASNIFLDPFAHERFVRIGPVAVNIVCAVVTLMIMSPFLYGMVIAAGKYKELYDGIWRESSAAGRGPLFAMSALKIFLAVAFVMAVVSHYLKPGLGIVILIASLAAAAFILLRLFNKRSSALESRFVENMRAKDEYQRQNAPVTTTIREKMDGHDICVERLTVSSDFKYAGQQLSDIPLRRDYGVNIVKIMRGSSIINIPSAAEFLFPADEILVVGTMDRVEAFKKALSEDVRVAEGDASAVEVESFIIEAGSLLAGKSLKMVDMRNSGCMLIGIERGEETYMNPEPDMIMQPGDTVWLVGAPEAIKLYR